DLLSKKYPALKVEITQLDIENALPALANGKVDLILGEDYPGVLPLTDHTVHREHLIDDELVLITPDDSQLTFEDFIKDAEVSAETAFAVDTSVPKPPVSSRIFATTSESSPWPESFEESITSLAPNSF